MPLFYRKTSQKKVDTAVHQHAIWLKTDGREGKRLNFSGYRLGDLNFSGADLSKAKFRDAEVSSANFADAVLDRTNFRCAMGFLTEMNPDELANAKTFGSFIVQKISPMRPPPRFSADGQVRHLVSPR